MSGFCVSNEGSNPRPLPAKVRPYNGLPMPVVTKQGSAPAIRFGDYELDRERGVLFRRGVALKLQPQPLRVLAFLIDRAPEIVSRETLADHIWGDGVHVEIEQSLNYCIRQIRQVLDDRPSDPQFIETLPRQGYRFIATVMQEPSAGGLAANEVDGFEVQSVGLQPLRQDQKSPPAASIESAAPIHSPLLTRRKFAWTAGVAVIAGGGLWLSDTLRRKPRAGAVNVSIPMPQGVGAADPSRALGPAVVAPDGSALVVSLRTSTGNHLYIRPLKSNQLSPLQGTQDGSEPFWSPDSQQVAFFAEGKLKRIPATGGSVIVLCEAQKPRGGSWGSRGKIIFGLNTMALFQVAESGGPVTPATQLDTTQGENSHRFPVFLPDGNRFLYLSRNDNPDRRGIYLESMDHSVPRKKILVADGGFALGRDPDTGDYFLLSEQGGRIVAQRFAIHRGDLEGQALSLVDRGGMVSASNTGVLAVRTEQRASGLIWRDRSGKKIGALGETMEFWAVAMSPNGQSIAAVKHDSVSGQFTVWVASLQQGVLELFSDANHADSVMWSADSNVVYYADIRQWKLFRRTLHPRGIEELVCELPNEASVLDVSPDGRYAAGELAMMSAHAQAAWTALQPSAAQNSKSDMWHQLGPSDAHGPLPHFSPDGKWLAFSSNQTGSAEIYVTDFPAGSQRHLVSTGGGRSPRWRSDGKELFYLSEGENLMAVPISIEGEPQIGKPDRLFAANLRVGGEGSLYDVSPDGQHFLLIDGGDGSGDSNIEMVLNWPSLLQ